MSNYKTTIHFNEEKQEIYFHIPDAYQDKEIPSPKELIKTMVKAIPFGEYKDIDPIISSINKVKVIPDGFHLFVFYGKEIICNEYHPWDDEELKNKIKSIAESENFACVKVSGNIDISIDSSIGSLMISKHIYLFKHYITKN